MSPAIKVLDERIALYKARGNSAPNKATREEYAFAVLVLVEVKQRVLAILGESRGGGRG